MGAEIFGGIELAPDIVKSQLVTIGKFDGRAPANWESLHWAYYNGSRWSSEVTGFSIE
jgi:hypothetical protein